jgi:tetratricopeptide (TPR) repeat protein
MTGASQQDLTAHPWAGLPVLARLVATDAAGQTGASEQAPLVLPERPFHNPLARAIIALRKTLSVNPDDRSDALAGLDELMQKPQLFGNDTGALLNLDAIYYLLVRQKAASAVPEAQERMWLLALHLEEGQTEQTARALELARQEARDAMRRAEEAPTDANRRALEQKLKELQEAIDRHMQALLEEARRNENLLPFDPEAHRLTNHDLDRLAERAREAARQGRMDEARRRVEELEQLLDQMRNARAASPNGQDQQQGSTQRRQRGRQQMGAVQDMISREGQLLDRAEGRVDQNQRPRGVPPPTTPTDDAAQQEADRRVQQALRRALGELMQQFGDLTGEIPPALTEADQAMREAGSSLAQGRDQAAQSAQQRAIEALQKGAREMGQAMARQFGPGGQEGQDGESDQPGQAMMGMMGDDRRGDGRSAGPIPGNPNRANPNGRDPLGRHNHGSSTDNADVVVPEERERQRTQAIQEELRRRGAERERPQQELDYIDRLLRQF